MTFKRILVASLVLTVVCGAAIAADSGETNMTDTANTTDLAQQIQNPMAGDIDGWHFKLMPYAWVPSVLKADATLSGLGGSVRLNTQDIIDNLGMLMFGRIEAWKDDKWGLSYDTFYLYLQYDDGFSLNPSAKKEIGGDRFNQKFAVDVNADVAFDIDIRLWMNDFAAHYRLVDQRFGDGNKERFIFEPYGGLRYTYLKEEATIQQNTNVSLSSSGSLGSGSQSASSSGKEKIGDSRDWVEPFVGGRISWDLNEKFTLWFRGDVGGFGIGSASDLTYNLIPGCAYKLTENTTVDFSYRYLNMDYSNGSGSDKLALDVEAYGPVIGMTILF
ncbi:MAG: YfaZ family protein [Planctomycetota bacterium]|jgi:opacity protein-like surface antigen